jgi:hypothetical protein
MHSDRKKQILRYAQNDTEFGWRERDEVEIEERSLPPASRQVVGARDGDGVPTTNKRQRQMARLSRPLQTRRLGAAIYGGVGRAGVAPPVLGCFFVFSPALASRANLCRASGAGLGGYANRGLRKHLGGAGWLGKAAAPFIPQGKEPPHSRVLVSGVRGGVSRVGRR